MATAQHQGGRAQEAGGKMSIARHHEHLQHVQRQAVVPVKAQSHDTGITSACCG